MMVFFEELLKVVSARLVALIVVGSLATYFGVDHNSNKNINTETELAENNLNQQLDKNDLRRPASINKINKRKNSEVYKAPVKIASYDQSNFVDINEAPLEKEEENNTNANINSENSSVYEGLASSNEGYYSPLAREIVDNSNPIKKNSSNNSSDSQNGASSGVVASNSISNIENNKVATISHSASASSASASSPASSSAPTPNTCTSNIVGGSFGNPIGVTLECVHPSTISYCLGKGACCDPETTATTYSTKVVVGAQNGNYCLSYYGHSEAEGDSVTYQQSYIINSTLPSLTIGTPKTFYQTTELEGTSFVSGQDFGKDNFYIGQINLKSHDPGLAGLNYNCEEIINNYATLSLPTPLEVLIPFEVALTSVSSQVEIPFRLDQIDYGDNFLTSYIINNNFDAPLYSCSTTKINLEDFEFFQVDVSQSEIGDNDVREFEGQFLPYGFFEEDAQVSRGPAGVSSQEMPDPDQSLNQTLKYGLMAMFY